MTNFKNLKIDVPSILVPGSKIMIVGEAPGREEVAQGKPFVGSSGQVLDKILSYGGVARDSVSISNVVKRGPKTGFTSEAFKLDFYTGERPTKELEDYREALYDELRVLAPNIIVAVGGEALSALTNVSGITNYRGSVVEGVEGIAKRKVIPMLHPSFMLRGNFQEFWIACLDFKNKVVPESAGSQISRRAFKSFVQPHLFQVLTLLNTMTDGPWSLDIETKPPVLWCIGIAQDDWSLSIPLHTAAGAYWSSNEEAQIWEALQTVASRNPRLVGQNITYDLDYLLDYGFEPSGIAMDTLVAHSLLYPEFPRGLDFIASLYTDAVYYKGESKIAGSKTPNQDLWLYNCKDCIYTLWASIEIEKQLRQVGLWDFYESYVNKEIGMALEMQRRGLPVSRTKMADLSRIAWASLRHVHEDIDRQAGQAVALSKPNDLRLLFKQLGYKVSKTTGSGLTSTDKDTISELMVKYPNDPILKLISQGKKLEKRLASYLNADLCSVDNLRSAWNVAGTETGRWSSSKSPKGGGLNLQTVPKVVRWAIEL